MTNLSNRQIALLVISICFICFTVIYFPVSRGFDAPFVSVTDNDTVNIGQALRLNSGKPQTYFDQGYLHLLFLSVSLKTGHLLGLIPLENVEQLTASNQFGQDFSRVIVFERYLLVLLNLGFVIVFTGSLYLYYRKLEIALFGGCLLAVTEGLVIHTLVIRSELISAFFVMVGLFAMLLALRSNWRTWTFISGMAFYAAAMSKVMAIISILLFPAFVFSFAFQSGQNQMHHGHESQSRNQRLLLGLFLGIEIVFLLLFMYGFARAAKLSLQSYHFLIVLAVLMSISLFKLVFKLSFRAVFTWCILFAFGCSTTYMLNYFHFMLTNTVAVFDFVRFGANFSAGHESNLILSAIRGITDAVVSRLSVDNIYGNPFNILSVFILITLFVQLFKRRLKESIQLSLFLFLPIILEGAFMTRHYSSMYHVYIEWIGIWGFLHAFNIMRKNQSLNKHLIGFLTATVGLMFIIQVFSHNQRKLVGNSFTAINLEQSAESFCSLSKVYSPSIWKIVNRTENCLEFVSRELNRK